MEALCKLRSDREVLKFLMFGWPISRDSSPLPEECDNHGSANGYKPQVTQYVMKELHNDKLLGPFTTLPFLHHQTGISPLSTRPK